ncbi:hypothetical protein [Ensifer canadensis]|uniref:hypothetical protein n=1 Tax=Ensifer canadensis TaxID=555315 RepID=UPI0035E3BF7F
MNIENSFFWPLVVAGAIFVATAAVRYPKTFSKLQTSIFIFGTGMFAIVSVYGIGHVNGMSLALKAAREAPGKTQETFWPDHLPSMNALFLAYVFTVGYLIVVDLVARMLREEAEKE